MDLVISVVYVTFLGIIGAMMAGESVRSILKISKKTTHTEKLPLAQRLPWKVEFPKSKLTISAIMPVAIGFFVGVMVSLMGIGGGFFLLPAMIYLLGMPTSVVIGTSLFQIIFITAHVTLLQAGGLGGGGAAGHAAGHTRSGRIFARHAGGAGAGCGHQAGVRVVYAAGRPLQREHHG
ncbi:MAG: sulfite exporter TauE/SafE family protein [Proteobacteria bacterium]|nr:sulfite exporter TauE/SafE family protein [Pseudomonadota bacterium]